MGRARLASSHSLRLISAMARKSDRLTLPSRETSRSLTLLNWHEVSDREVSLLGNVSLSLFLAMALMSLKLWELASLALPIFILLAVQTVAMALYAIFVTFRVMGRNYDAAVLAAGHCGFGLGATPTAIANMQAITQRFGPSHLAFLVVPMVGAFFIDIINAVVADEVRVLSRRTQDSTQEIQSTIKTLQQTTARAVSLMQTSQGLADNSVKDADAAAAALEEITQAVSLISDMAGQIATAAEEQTQVTGEIIQNTTAINDVSDEITASAMRDLDQAHNLKGRATNLNQQVSTFIL